MSAPTPPVPRRRPQTSLRPYGLTIIFPTPSRYWLAIWNASSMRSMFLECVSSGANHAACAPSNSRASSVSWFDRRTLKSVSSLRLIADAFTCTIRCRMNPGKHHAACIARDLSGLAGGFCSGSAVNRAVHAALPRCAENLLDRFAGLEYHVGANSAGQLAAVRQPLHSPDAPCMLGFERGDRQ